jgi:hypothetical protein
MIYASGRERGANKRAADEHAVGEIRPRIGRRQNVVGVSGGVGNEASAPNVNAAHDIARSELRKLPPVCRWVEAADVEHGAALELHVNDAMVGHRSPMHFDDGYRHDAAVVHAVDEIADPNRGNGAIAVFGCDWRIRGCADGRVRAPEQAVFASTKHARAAVALRVRSAGTLLTMMQVGRTGNAVEV